MQKDIKKPLLSGDLAVGDNKGLQSADADQHRDRIARFGVLKHRANNKKIIYGRLLHLIPIKTPKTNDLFSPVKQLISSINALIICYSKIITP